MTSNMKPFTPVRKLLLKLDLFKPSNTLGKRRRDQENGAVTEDTDANTSVQARPAAAPIRAHHPSPGQHSSPQVCVALQNSDPTEFSDVVIITALSAVPFCCHEDLLTMSREQLIGVALSLNAKLPAALSIDVSPARTDNFIRNSIEIIVGLRRDVPPAPKAVKTYSQEYIHEPDTNPSPPTSPLAMRCRSYDLYTSRGTPRLARLQEEEDEDAMEIDMDRHVKKRKVSAPTPTKEQHPGSLSPGMEMDTPTPPPRRLIRAQTHRAAPDLPGSPTPKRVLRSHSHKLPSDMKARRPATIDTAFITTTRPRYRYKPRVSQANSRTGTDAGSQVTISMNYRSSLGTRQGSTSTSTIDQDVDVAGSAPTTTTATRAGFGGTKRRWSKGDEDEEMVGGIDGMNMGADVDDMNVCKA